MLINNTFLVNSITLRKSLLSNHLNVLVQKNVKSKSPFQFYDIAPLM